MTTNIFIAFVIIPFFIIIISAFFFKNQDRRNLVNLKYYNIQNYEGNIENNEICTICLEQLDNVKESDDKIIILNCGHKFHIECINKWTIENIKIKHQKKVLCPLCKDMYCSIAV